MLERLVFYVNQQQLTAGYWQRGRLDRFWQFQADENGIHQFTQLLYEFKRLKTYLLVDSFEEDFQSEAIPFVNRRSTADMLARRLAAFNRHAEFKTAQFIRQEKTTRRENHYLLLALNKIDFLQPWLALIERYETPLEGVYTLPMLDAQLARHLNLTAKHALLVEKLHSGLRQTFLDSYQLRLSRLLAPSEAPGKQLRDLFITETDRTRLYLLRQRLIENDAALTVYVMPFGLQHVGQTLVEADAQGIDESIVRELGLSAVMLNAKDMAERLNLAPTLLEQNPELVHMQLLVNDPPTANMIPERLRQNYNVYRWRRFFWYGAAAMLLAGLLAMAWLAFLLWQEQTQTAQAAQQTTAQKQLYGTAMRDFSAMPLPANDMRTLVEAHDTLTQHFATPHAALQMLSRVLQQEPLIQVNRIRWVLSNTPNVADAELLSTNSSATSTPPQANNSAASSLVQVILFTGEVKPFDGDYRAAFATVNQFASQLRQQAGVSEVQITQEPVNVNSLSNLEGTTTDQSNQQVQAAFFKLRIVMALHEETPP